MNHDNNNNSCSELDSVISYVKDEFKNILAKRKELILKLGEAYEKVVSNPESICEKIKAALHEEIAQKIVSARMIEKYCHDKWKRKTRPKNEKTSISHKQELEKVPPNRIAIDTQGIVVDEESMPIIPDDDNPKGYLEADAQEIKEHNRNREADQHANNLTISSSGNEVVVDCECSIPWPIMQRYVQHVYKSGEPLSVWINFQFNKQTGTVVAAYLGRIAERNRMDGEFSGVILENV